MTDLPLDRLRPLFTALQPNERWAAALIWVATWERLVYVAFMTELFAARSVGWRVSRTWHSYLVLDALQGTRCARQSNCMFAHHGSRGSQYQSIR